MSSAHTDAGERAERVLLASKKLSGRDLVGRAAEVIGTTGGMAAGAAGAGTVASIAGASTIFGSTALGGLLGGVFVAATPVGWVIGAAAIGGLAGYSIARLARSGAAADARRRELKERLERMASEPAHPARLGEQAEIEILLAAAVDEDLIDAPTASRMRELVNDGRLPASLARDRLRRLLTGNERLS